MIPPAPGQSSPVVAAGVVTAAPHRGWWHRNWKWAVGGGVVVFVVGFVGFVLLIFALVLGVIKSTEVYETALSAAKREPAVISALGAPIDDGMLFTGNLEANPGSGYADLAIPIHGPRGKGTIYVVADKARGRWSYETLEVALHDSGEMIDLLGR